MNTRLICSLLSVAIRTDLNAASPGWLPRPTSAIKIEKVKKKQMKRQGLGEREIDRDIEMERERERRRFHPDIQLPGISPYITAEL